MHAYVYIDICVYIYMCVYMHVHCMVRIHIYIYVICIYLYMVHRHMHLGVLPVLLATVVLHGRHDIVVLCGRGAGVPISLAMPKSVISGPQELEVRRRVAIVEQGPERHTVPSSFSRASAQCNPAYHSPQLLMRPLACAHRRRRKTPGGSLSTDQDGPRRPPSAALFSQSRQAFKLAIRS